MLPSKRTQKRKGIDLLSFCPQPPKLTTRAIMEAHAPAIDDGASPRLLQQPLPRANHMQ